MPEIICREVRGETELSACFAIRRKIFVDEQQLFDGTDRDDHDPEAVHIGAFFNDRIIGTVRVYAGDSGIWWGGRLAVVKRFRGRAGKLLVQKAMEIVRTKNACCFRAYIQAENVNFFKSLGWKPVGDGAVYHGKPHQLMEAALIP
jgi:putative N-acetyltransferase (TIGR04045 family)